MKKLKGKRVLVVSDGALNKFRGLNSIIKSCGYVIAADGGLNNAVKLKIKPDLIIGDFDSSDLLKVRKTYGRKSTKVYPKDKDNSDTELAIRYALRAGAKGVTVIGALGKRIDHALANIFSAGSYADKVTLIDEFCELTVHSSSFSIRGKRGDTLSILPFFSNVRNVSGKGFKYPLKNLTLKAGSLGLSNEMASINARVSFKSGKILLIKVREK